VFGGNAVSNDETTGRNFQVLGEEADGAGVSLAFVGGASGVNFEGSRRERNKAIVTRFGEDSDGEFYHVKKPDICQA